MKKPISVDKNMLASNIHMNTKKLPFINKAIKVNHRFIHSNIQMKHYLDQLIIHKILLVLL